MAKLSEGGLGSLPEVTHFSKAYQLVFRSSTSLCSGLDAATFLRWGTGAPVPTIWLTPRLPATALLPVISPTAQSRGCCLSFPQRDPAPQPLSRVLHWTQISTPPAVFPAVAFWLLADWRDVSVGSSGIPFVSFLSLGSP